MNGREQKTKRLKQQSADEDTQNVKDMATDQYRSHTRQKEETATDIINTVHILRFIMRFNLFSAELLETFDVNNKKIPFHTGRNVEECCLWLLQWVKWERALMMVKYWTFDCNYIQYN